jgi:hypothetical protein
MRALPADRGRLNERSPTCCSRRAIVRKPLYPHMKPRIILRKPPVSEAKPRLSHTEASVPESRASGSERRRCVGRRRSSGMRVPASGLSLARPAFRERAARLAHQSVSLSGSTSARADQTRRCPTLDVDSRSTARASLRVSAGHSFAHRIRCATDEPLRSPRAMVRPRSCPPHTTAPTAVSLPPSTRATLSSSERSTAGASRAKPTTRGS